MLMVIGSLIFCSGGLLFWADLVGPKHVYASLKKWSEQYGDFFKPSKYLEERAAKGIPLVRSLFSSLLFTLFCMNAISLSLSPP